MTGMQTPLRGEEFFAQQEGRELLKLQARQLVNRIINKALYEWDAEYNAALARGERLTLGSGKEDLRVLLLKHATKELASGNDK